MHSLPVVLSLLSLLSAGYAAPAPVPLFGFNFGAGQTTNGAPTAISQSTIDANLQRPAFFARLAYCSPQAVTALSCGGPCDAVKGFQTLQSGGDQAAIPRCELSSSLPNRVFTHQAMPSQSSSEWIRALNPLWLGMRALTQRRYYLSPMMPKSNRLR